MPRDERDLEQLLGDTRWVRALAGRLCADAGAADDLAQEAWVAALRSAPTSGGGARPWFARVLSNLARQRWRSESARRARELAVGGERMRAAEASGEDLVARADASRRLVDQVLALDEPYRSTLLAHFYDDQRPTEIARRTGTSASTVRTRLERGLAQLRVRVEREGGASWLAAIVPLAPPTHVSLTTAMFGGWLMTNSTKVALGLAAALAVGWLAWPEATSGPTDNRSSAADPARTELAEPREPELVASMDEPRTSAEAPAPIPVVSATSSSASVDLEALATETEPGFLVGIVVRDCMPVTRGKIWYRRGGANVGGGTIPADLASFVGNVDDEHLASTPIDDDGRFRAGPLATDVYTVAVDLGAGVGLHSLARVDEHAPGRQIVLELGCARIEGHVYDELGSPIEGALIRLSYQDPRALFGHYAITRSDGRYEIRDLSTRGRWITLDSDGRAGADSTIEGMQRLPAFEPHEVRVVDFGSPQRAVAWSGRVLTQDGATPKFGGTLGWSSPNGSYTEVPLERDASFDLRVRPGTYVLQVKISTTEWGTGTEYLALGTFEVAERDFERDLVLPGTTVRGTVIGIALGELPRRTGVALLNSDDLPTRDAQVDERGQFSFLAVPAGRYRVVSGPVLTVSPETWIDVRDGDLEVVVDVPVQWK